MTQDESQQLDLWGSSSQSDATQAVLGEKRSGNNGNLIGKFVARLSGFTKFDPDRFSTADMHEALWQAFRHSGWMVHEELPEPPSDAVDSLEYPPRRVIDALALRPNTNNTPEKEFENEILALELKVGRGDFLADIKRPEKQDPWRRLASHHAYVAPTGLITVDEVPLASGLIEVRRSVINNWSLDNQESPIDVEYIFEWAKRGPYTEKSMAPRLAAYIFARASSADARARGRTYQSPEGDVAPIGERIETIRREWERSQKALGRSIREIERWQRIAGASGISFICEYCDEMLKIRSFSSQTESWKHYSRALESSCKSIRETVGHHRAREKWAEWYGDERAVPERWREEIVARGIAEEPWRYNYVDIPRAIPMYRPYDAS